ncbi:hypothetical protein RhiirA1_105900 [Rhizophagus irregularis]|uniref:Uncharacterized protein n=1 Tax=Rhizophagus irregularis TaxID=588596 RepID=A0A2N0SIT6_9GLOM|nr:hypothetical protein RhiirA1_105900 [Rhizophagus irregularis]
MSEIEVVAIFGVGDYVWVPWSTIVNSISIKVKNELSRKIRGNRLVFQLFIACWRIILIKAACLTKYFVKLIPISSYRI